MLFSPLARRPLSTSLLSSLPLRDKADFSGGSPGVFAALKPALPRAASRCLGFLAIALLLPALAALVGCGGGSRKVLYVAGTGTPNVLLFQVLNNGSLAATNDLIGTGASPDALVITPSKKYFYVADSAGSTLPGGVSQYTVSSSSGVLTILTVASNTSTTTLNNPTPPAPAGINPLALAIDSSSKFLFAANQGSASISVYSIDPSTGLLTEISGSPFATAAGPSALAIISNALFVANQSAGQVSVYTFNQNTGALTQVSGSPFPAGVAPRSLRVDFSGKFLYVADQASKAVLGFAIQSGGSGQLSPLSGSPFAVGSAPVNLLIVGKFLYVANQGSGNVSAFAIDGGSGALTAVSGSPYAVGANPSFIATDSSGKFLFVANQGANTISAFTPGADGSLSAVSGSPFPAGVVGPVALLSIN